MEEPFAIAESRLKNVDKGWPSIFLYSILTDDGWRYEVCFYYDTDTQKFVVILDEWLPRGTGREGFHLAEESETLLGVIQWANDMTRGLRGINIVDITHFANEAFWHGPGNSWLEAN